MEINKLNKSELRYILYLARTSSENNKVLYKEEHLNTLIHFESLEGFKKYGGWLEFAKKWDVFKDESGDWQITKRHISEEREWDAVVLYRAEIFPTLEGGEYKKILK